MASAAANQTITTASTEIFNQANDGGKCCRFFVGVRSTVSNPLLVTIPGLHKDGEWIGMPAGSSLEFTMMPMGIAKVLAKGDGGSCNGVDWGVLESERSNMG